jgi:hypothetical protein
MRLQAEVEKIKGKFDAEKRKLELANRSKWEKFWDGFVKWRRASALTGISTLGKLGTAALGRIIISPIEELYGGIISKIPGISLFAKEAPREGGINLRAEAKAISQLWKKATYKDIKDIIVSGKGSLDQLFGKKGDLPPEALDFFGQLHSALKATPKRAEFFRSFEKRLEFAAKKGFDVNDPTVQATIAAQSYIDANRSIFMNDNMATDAYKIALNYLDKKGDTGKLAASLAKILMPIVKVPTNYVLETSHYAFGIPKAVISMSHALLKGLDNMTPEQADYVMRMLKKGSIGGALFTLGYFNSQNFGGYYYGKRDKKDASKPNEMIVFGWHVPHWAQHIPVLEMLQFGATVRRVEDAYDVKNEKAQKKGNETTNSVGAGFFHAGTGLLGEVPFFDQSKRLIQAATTPQQASAYTGDLTRSLVVPQGVQDIAKFTDSEEQRKPKNYWDRIKMGIPVLREQVPVKNEKKHK